MSKRENHWYLLRAIAEAFGRSLRRPRALPFVIWLALIAFFLVVWNVGGFGAVAKVAGAIKSPLGIPVVLAATFALFYGILRLRLARFRADYLAALALPGPETLLQVIDRGLQQARRMSDGDALLASARATPYAFYGRADDADRTLAAVDWKARPPLIQAVGLSAEVLVVLLCRRNVARALELARQARALSAVSDAVPGAAQARRAHDTCVAAAEALADQAPAERLAVLERSAADARMPDMQLLATLALAVAHERAGDDARAAERRAFLRATAPHCAPLHLQAADFAAQASGEPAAGPVSSALPAPGTPAAASQTQQAKRRALRALVPLVGVWLLLIAAFALIYLLFKQPK